MPPQEDEQTVTVPAPINNENEAKESAAASYWDEPPEEKLQGKTLSTLSLTRLGRAAGDDEEEDKEQKDENDAPVMIQAEQPSTASYWNFPETIRKSLSKLSLTDLTRGASSSTAEAGDSSSTIQRKPSSNSFWLWPNRSMSNLQDVETDSKKDDNKEGSTKTNPTGGYWFWRSASANNLTDSQVSLEALEKKARETDKRQGQGPISNLSHRMRNSWRASFQRFSSNTLSKLDESSPSSSLPTSAKGEAENDKSMKRIDSFVVQEEDEQAMTF